MNMTSITIRKLEPELKSRLRLRAAQKGRSMEEEARAILRSALATAPRQPANLAQRIHARFAKYAGLDLPIPLRTSTKKPPRFGR